MPRGEITRAIEAAFQEVIGPDIPVTRTIQSLNQDTVTATYFTDLLKSLRVLSISEKGKIDIFESARKRETNTIYKRPVGKGTYGTIYRNKIGDAVYKKISFSATNQKQLEENIREVFLESFIQTVLSSDVSYGQNVSRIIGLYREFPDKQVAGKTTMYIKMEAVSSSIDKLLAELREASPSGIKWSTIKPTLKQLGNILKYFEKSYNFHHRDLHTGNVMFDSRGQVKLIDFGRSCITAQYGGTEVTYSLVRENVIEQPASLAAINTRPRVSGTPCSSYDLLIFIISLIEYDADKFDAECQERLNAFVTQPDGTNLFTFWEKNRENDSNAVFWKMYPDVVAQWEGVTQTYKVGKKTVSETLSPADTPISSPDDFVAAIATMAGGSRKTRRNKRKARRSTRRN